MGRLAKNLLLLCCSLLIALVLGEIVTRLYFVFQDRSVRRKNLDNIITLVPQDDIFTPANLGAFTNKANFSARWWGFDLRTDSLGCRMELPAPDSARIILFLGDSMIFGVGLSDSQTVPARLQSELTRQTPQHPPRVVNAAVIGYGFQQYLFQMQRLAPPLKPEMVLVGICHNDLFPSEDPFGTIMTEDQTEASLTPQKERQRSGGMAKLFYFPNKLIAHTALFRLYRQISKFSGGGGGRAVNYKPAQTAAAEQAPQVVFDFIRTAHELNVPIAFISFPLLHSIGRPSDLVYIKLLQDQGQKVLDLGLSTVIGQESYFCIERGGNILPDMHYNAAGSRKVAGELARWLVEQGLWK
jgi:lysophospholipase L1-like esterase